MKAKAVSYAGWYGVLVILIAYILLSFSVISSKSYAYQLMNLTGSVGIIIEALSKKDRQPAVLNAAWALVALIAIFRLYIK